MASTRPALVAPVALLVLLLLLVLLGGCSDDDPEPDIGAPTSSALTASTPSLSTTGSASSTVMPTTPLGPEETVRAWVAARNDALRNGDTSAVELLGTDACTTCEDSLEPIREVYANGGHYETEGWKILATRVEPKSSTTAKVNTGIEYAAGRTFLEAGSDPITYDIEKHIVVFRLGLETDGWRIAFIGYLS
jgi:hypothetical protein